VRLYTSTVHGSACLDLVASRSQVARFNPFRKGWHGVTEEAHHAEHLLAVLEYLDGTVWRIWGEVMGRMGWAFGGWGEMESWERGERGMGWEIGAGLARLNACSSRAAHRSTYFSSGCAFEDELCLWPPPLS
jgi:hypothetical protein